MVHTSLVYTLLCFLSGMKQRTKATSKSMGCHLRKLLLCSQTHGIDIEDPKHSTSMEIRTIRLGKSRLSRVLIVVNTMKLTVDTKSVIRIISARRANRKERKIYEGADI